MALIAILIALFIERFLGSLEEFRKADWIGPYSNWLRQRLPDMGSWHGPLCVIAVAAGPMVVIALLANFLDSYAWLVSFFFSIAVLLYSFGPMDLEAVVEAFVDARERGDDESATWHASELLGEDLPEGMNEQTQALMETILVEANDRLLAIMFWFVILGPVGALFYRYVCTLRRDTAGEESDFSTSIRRLHFILGWLPAHLTSLSYALGGSFVESMHYWRSEAGKWEDHNRGILVTSGLGALRFNLGAVDDELDKACETDAVRETMALVRRAVLVFLTLLAVLILAGWSP